jgi:uncharacterized protein YlxW (UPF0749 family)
MFGRQTRWILFSIMLFLGVIFALQVRSTLIYLNNHQNPDDEMFLQQYTEQLNSEKESGIKLAAELKQIEKEKEDILRSASFYMKDIDSINMLENYKIAAGLTDVKGTGLKIILNDAVTSSKSNPNTSVVHNTDLFIILNLLKKSGVQAISINGQRIIATSEVVCTGPTVRINRYRYPVPYEIIVIGDPDILYTTISESETVAVLRLDGIRVDISKQKEIVVPGYIGDRERLVAGLVEVSQIPEEDNNEEQ